MSMDALRKRHPWLFWGGNIVALAAVVVMPWPVMGALFSSGLFLTPSAIESYGLELTWPQQAAWTWLPLVVAVVAAAALYMLLATLTRTQLPKWARWVGVVVLVLLGAYNVFPVCIGLLHTLLWLMI